MLFDKIKVCMFSLDFPYRGTAGVTTKGGAGACIKQLGDGLHARGADVTIVAGKHSDYKKEIVPYNVHRVPNIFFGFRESKAFGMPMMAAVSLGLPSDFDIVHAHNPPGFLAGYFFAKRIGNPIVLTMHGPWADLRGRLKPLARKIEQFALSHADAITNDSIALNKRLSHLYDTKDIRVIHNAIETDRFKPGPKNAAKIALKIPASKFVVLYTGRFVREKHIDDLLNTLPYVTSRTKDILYLLVGGGFDQNLVTDWIKDNPKFKDNIKIIPFVSQSKMPMIYNAADIFILPTEAEGMSRSLLEAMAAGVPSIVTNIEANSELINDHRGILYLPGNIRMLSAAIVRLYSDKEMRVRFSKLSRQHVIENHSVDARIQAFINLYLSILAEKAEGEYQDRDGGH